jgi:hypothetical protein
MIRKSPGLDPGTAPLFRKDHASAKIQSAMTAKPKAIAL